MEVVKMRIWKDENGGFINELALLAEFIELQTAGSIGPELRFPDYIRECEGKNGTLTLIEG
jgi:hypothetical protein